MTEAINGFVEALGTFFTTISSDVDISKVSQKTELLLKQDHLGTLVVLSSLLEKLQDVLTYFGENQIPQKIEIEDTDCMTEHIPRLNVKTMEQPCSTRVLDHSLVQIRADKAEDVLACFGENQIAQKLETEDTDCTTSTKHMPVLNVKIEQPSTSRVLDQSLVQIRADKAEMERRIAAFIERKQKEVDDTNVREFCGLLHPNSEGDSCARTDAMFLPRSDSKSHVKVTKVENLYGPQTRLLNTSHQVDARMLGIKEDFGGGGSHHKVAGIEERLKTMEEHAQINTGTKDVFRRIKALEERILYLESLSPEYFTVCSTKRKRSREDKFQNKKQYKHQSQVLETSAIDDKIQLLKAKIMANKVKKDPG